MEFLEGLSTTYLFLLAAKQLHKFLSFNPPVYYYQSKEGSNQMALWSTYLAPTFISVRVVMHAALQQSKFHSYANTKTNLCHPPVYD